MSNSSAQAADTPGAYPSDAEGFTFLEGRWRVKHRKLKEPLTGRTEWLEFEGSARFVTLLDGLMSVEDLRNAEGKPFGGALRTFDRDKRVWSDAWIPERTGVMQPPQYGSFVNGVGTFTSEDTYEGKPILARGIWRRVSDDVVTWEQEASTDNGKTWELNWFMRFERVSETP